MPTFETPGPISLVVDLGAASVRLVAGDRTDTTVEVRPTDPSDESDVKAAAQVRADYANGTLTVEGPKFRAFDFSKKSRSVAVTIELPAGSNVRGDLQMGNFRCIGPLGGCRLRTAAGDLGLDRTGPAHLHTAAGHVTVDRVGGDADISTGSGRVHVGEIDGAAVVKNSNGDTEIGTVTGNARVRAANGDISVGHALGGQVEAKSANGDIRLGEVTHGSVDLKTSMGDVEVGIAEGTAAWLDVYTGFGRMVRELGEATAPSPQSDGSVEVHAHTSYGDITVRRS
ncbi:hypothetical protein BJF78_27730 [Pseudonocardia sp. CNS-139]|nr:hypothetical protein BJF78_27730 [Pseudonocardia sp. CNS-139]